MAANAGCVSTLNVEAFATRMSLFLDVDGDGAVTESDHLQPNDVTGDGTNSFQVMHPDDYLFASSTGSVWDCPQPDLGLVPGVFLGAFVAAALFGELKLEGFSGGASMRRYLVGALLMGFGGMTAGGCAVGAGLSGASVFTVTSWVTLCAMWAGAALTDRLIDHSGREAAQPNLGDQPVPASRAFT